MPRIFISYRREDSAPYAGRLHDRLSACFGSNQIFMDIDTIRPGEDFVGAITKAVDSCDTLIAIIGERWLDITDNEGRRRLDNPDDVVRTEIRAALDRNILVVPVLVGGANMPRSEELPKELASVARRNAIQISENRFDYDVSKLIEALGGKAGTGPKGDSSTRSKWIWHVIHFFFALGGGWIAYRLLFEISQGEALPHHQIQGLRSMVHSMAPLTVLLVGGFVAAMTLSRSRGKGRPISSFLVGFCLNLVALGIVAYIYSLEHLQR